MLGMHAQPVAAETTAIQNSVHVNSSSGGNVILRGSDGANGADGTPGKDGSSVNEISVRTVINGATAEDYSAKSATPIQYRHATSTTTATSTTNITASASSSAYSSKNAAVRDGTKPHVAKKTSATTSLVARATTDFNNDVSTSAKQQVPVSGSIIKTLFTNLSVYVFSFFSF
jgi:hypothetical protein